MRVSFADYLEYGRAELLGRLAEVTQELVDGIREHGIMVEQEKRAKIEGYRYSEESTVTGKGRDADLHALEASCEVIRIRAEVDLLREEQTLLRTLLEWTNAEPVAAVAADQ